MDINLKEKEEGIGIQNIEIRFISNVSPDTVNKLNRGMFYLPGDKEKSENKDAPGKEGMKGGKTTTDSEYPYFTDTSQLNIDKLSKLSRPDLLDAFFNKKNFKRYLDKGKSSDRDTRLLNSDFNFNAMMKLLLCTTFPVKHNIQNTFSENITQVASNSQSDATSVIDMIKNIVSKPFDKYCYFTIDGTQYTLLSITHINDLINDKIFDNTFKTLFAFKQWRDRKIQKLEAERVDLNNTFQKAFEANFTQMKDTLNTKDYKGHIDKLADSRQLALPRLLLKPYLDVLKSETSQNSVEIAFLKIANLNYTGSKETSASFWLPPVFARIAGFTEMMKSIFESTIIQKQLIYLKSDLTDLKKIMKKSNEKKNQLKDADEEIAMDKLQKTNEINDFLNKIKKITPPMRMYSNRKLEDMFEKLNNDDLFKFIQFIHDMKKEDNLDKSLFNNNASINKLKTGVMAVIEKNESSDKETKDLFGISSKKYYDTFVSLDLIKGELNKDNIDAIKCPYKNTMLSNEYLKLQDLSNEKNPALIYIPTIVLDMKVLKQNNKSNKKRTQRKRKQNGGWQPAQLKRATRKKKDKRKQPKKKNSEDNTNIKSIKSIKSINSVDSKSVANNED